MNVVIPLLLLGQGLSITYLIPQGLSFVSVDIGHGPYQSPPARMIALKEEGQVMVMTVTPGVPPEPTPEVGSPVCNSNLQKSFAVDWKHVIDDPKEESEQQKFCSKLEKSCCTQGLFNHLLESLRKGITKLRIKFNRLSTFVRSLKKEAKGVIDELKKSDNPKGESLIQEFSWLVSSVDQTETSVWATYNAIIRYRSGLICTICDARASKNFFIKDSVEHFKVNAAQCKENIETWNKASVIKNFLLKYAKLQARKGNVAQEDIEGIESSIVNAKLKSMNCAFESTDIISNNECLKICSTVGNPIAQFDVDNIFRLFDLIKDLNVNATWDLKKIKEVSDSEDSDMQRMIEFIDVRKEGPFQFKQFFFVFVNRGGVHPSRVGFGFAQLISAAFLTLICFLLI